MTGDRSMILAPARAGIGESLLVKYNLDMTELPHFPMLSPPRRLDPLTAAGKVKWEGEDAPAYIVKAAQKRPLWSRG